MPAIGPNSLVVVTGASGFLAVHCVHQLLERGHRVRATVRSDEKGQYLAQLFDKRHPGKFSFVIAEDLEHPGVFDEAVRDADAVLHTASPFHMNTEGRATETLIKPALRGTTNVLESILKSKTVKRVVVTSSFAAIFTPTKKPPQTYTEADWNEVSVAGHEKDGDAQVPVEAYRASKTLAERAAWDFVASHQPTWDLATINPPFVLGPCLQQVGSAEKLNTSMALIWAFTHGKKQDSDLPAPSGSVVDVRDAAQAHVEALLRADAGGQRFAPAAQTWAHQDLVDALHASSVVPDAWKKQTPKGQPGSGKGLPNQELIGTKTKEQLGVQYHDFVKTIDDGVLSLLDLEKRGWKGLPDEAIVFL